MRPTNAQRHTHTATHARDRAHRTDPPSHPKPKPPEGPHIRSPTPRQRPGQVRRTKLTQERPGP
eukprot:5280956-Alexandrium_andersonii.AAC.1